jgi:flagellar motor switch protein FliN/FliY
VSIDPQAFRDVRLRVAVELGRAEMPVARAVSLPTGVIVDLDRAADDPVDLLVNGRALGRGRLVVVDGEWALRIDEITDADGVRQASNAPEA